MPPVFPGMDPFIEGQAWSDFHLLFIAEIRRRLARSLPPRYIARSEEHIYLVWGEGRGRVRPDVAVARREPAQPSGAGPALLEAPVTLPLPIAEETRQRFLQVRLREGGRVVCVLELLSPVNKQRDLGRQEYLAKRTSLLHSTAHLVELDLLRGGERLPMDEPLPPAEFYALVSRATERPLCGVWPIRLRDRLPVIPLPLTEGDPDAELDLQSVFEAVYDAAGYAAGLDYSGEPQPALLPDDRAWAAGLLKAAHPA